MNSSVSVCLPFCTQSCGIKATFLHDALIYFSPLHNAAQAVRCMNKERESFSLFICLSVSLSLLGRQAFYLRSWTVAEGTRDYFEDVRAKNAKIPSNMLFFFFKTIYF